MWRFKESGAIAWHTRFLDVCSRPKVITLSLLFIAIAAYFLFNIYFSNAFDGGSGTPDDPYIISTCAQLQEIDDQPEYLYASYVLSNDIDCSAIVPFESIGNFQAFDGNFLPFTGRFDGDGRTISNIVVGSTTTSFNGIFATLYGASVRDLNLDSITVNGINRNGTLAGRAEFSAIIGVSVVNSTVTAHTNNGGGAGGVVGTMLGGYIYGVKVSSTTVSSTGTNHTGFFGFGGIAGSIQRFVTIDNSFSTATVTADFNGVGGITGYIAEGSVIKNSYSGGAVTGYGAVGGVSGYFATFLGVDTYIHATYSSTTLTATNPSGRVGGINGSASTGSVASLNISDSFAVGAIGSTTNSGGISGIRLSPSSRLKNTVYYPTGTGQTRCTPPTATYTATQCTTNDTSSYFNSNVNAPLSSWDFVNVWSEVIGDRPELQIFPYTEPMSATPVTTCAELAGGVRANPVGWFTLSNSIDCAGDPTLLPLPGNTATSSGFFGNFDGQGNTVSGVTASKSSVQTHNYGLGLFNRLYGAEVSNLTLTGTGISALTDSVGMVGSLAGVGMSIVVSDVTSSVPVTVGEYYGGGLIGFASGNFSNVNVSGNIDALAPDPYWLGGIVGSSLTLLMDNVVYSGDITGYWYTGGIAGNADFANITNATTTGAMVANVQVGGMFGSAGGVVATKSTINNVHSTVSITPNSSVDNYFESIGGIVGTANRVDISDSSFEGVLTVPDSDGAYVTYVGGLAGYLGGTTGISTSTIFNSSSKASIILQGGNGNEPYVESVGGMVGGGDSLEISNSYSSTSMLFGSEPAANYIDSVNNVGGLIGINSDFLIVSDVLAEGSIHVFEDTSGAPGGYGYGLGGFGGYLDGATISNSTSSVDVYLKSYQPGAISNFVGDFEYSTVTNVLIDGNFIVEAYQDPYSIGGLAGYATGLIVATTTVTGDITITDSLWPYNIGGLIGYLDSYSTIQQTYTDNIISIEAGSNGTSRGPFSVGGFIGEMGNDNILRDTYSSTSISVLTTALNQPQAGGNIGGYIGYVNWENNLITNSYATGDISIVSDITAVFQRIGGFIGWSNWGTNTYTDNFTVTSIAPIASSTNVGGFIGQYTGGETFSGNYYDQTRTQQLVCSGVDAVDPAWCNAQNIAAAEPTYFFDATNPPLSTWDFTNIWLEHPDTYPTFGVSPPMGSTPPTVTTVDPATLITQSAAQAEGNITSLGSGAVTARGFVYGTTPLFGATSTRTNVGFSVGLFNATLSGLVCNTTYYFAAYASGTDGRDYGATESFTTSACAPGATPPTVSTTVSASSITQTAATLSGNISSLGSVTITTRGFAYGTTPALGATTTENSAGFSTGGYSTGIASLTCNTTYYFRAYATGADGTGYGTTQNFTTAACATPPPPADNNNSSATRVKQKADTQVGVLKKTDSITICHQAGNEKYVTNTNVQVFIDLAKSGYIATLRGHDGHTGDIVPSFTYDLGEGIKTYEGNNWSTTNKILHANNCELFLKPNVPSKQPAVVVPPSVVVPGVVVEPGEETLPTCDIRSVYTQVSSTLSDSVVAKATVPAGAVKSKKVESNGKSNYALTLEVKPINSKKAETYTEKFTSILVKYQENTDNDNVPFGIEKKLKVAPYTPPQSETIKQTDTVTTTNIVRVESKPPCTVETVVTENRPAEPVVALPPVVVPQTESEEVVIVSDILELTDVLEWDLTEVKMPIPPFEVSITDELGNVITEFTEPVVIEIAHPSILGSENSIQVMQPSADGTTWYEVPFEVDGDTIRITIQNPGEFFIWFLPKTVEAADEQAAPSAGLVPWLTIEFPRWLLAVASYFGFGAGVLLLLMQLSRMPIALEHLSRNLSGGLNNLIGLIIFRKKRRPWGTVYDSVTKAPVDPAYVELFDELGNKKAEAFTDLDGRYGFLVPQGSYSMMIRKTNYTFPSSMANVTGQDVIYHNLYFGGVFSVSDTVVHDVPMDPQGFDWNQSEKLRTKQTRYFNKLDPIFISILDVVFYLGFLAMSWQFILNITLTTGVLLALYAVLLLLRFVSGKPPLYGTITKSGQPLSFSILRVLQDGKEILTKIVDVHGRYIALVPNGEYTLVIEEHIMDDQYRTVYERKIRAKHGVINPRIRM